MQVAARLRPRLRRGHPELTLAGAPEMTDADRFEAFVREYQDMVFATAVRLLANPAEAEDIAQTVFLRAFERFSTIETSATAAGWLKTVTTNLCLNHLARYRARWQFFSELDRAGRRRTIRSHGARAGDARMRSKKRRASNNSSGRCTRSPIISGCRWSSFTSRT